MAVYVCMHLSNGVHVTDISIEDFCKNLETNDRKPAAKVYYYSLRGFEKWLEKNGKNINVFTSGDFERYFSLIKNARTANLFRAAVKSYLKYRAGSLEFGDSSVIIETQRISQIDLVRNKRQSNPMVKNSLTPEELTIFLEKLSDSHLNSLVYSLAVMEAYFGARPIEIELHLKSAKIDWKERSMYLRTAKMGDSVRYLPWNDKITPYIQHVYKSPKIKYAGSYLTKNLTSWQKHMKKPIFKDIVVTAKTFRKSFQTQQRLLGTPDIFIDFVLGHVSKTSAIGDVYTDRTAFIDPIRKLMLEDHYMIKYGVI